MRTSINSYYELALIFRIGHLTTTTVCFFSIFPNSCVIMDWSSTKDTTQTKATHKLILSESAALDELMRLYVWVLRHHLKTHHLLCTGNKSILAHTFLEYFQGLLDPSQPNNQIWDDDLPFNTVQQAAFQQALLSVLANASKDASPTLSHPKASFGWCH